MTQKIYLSPAVTDIITEKLETLITEARRLRKGHELYDWEAEISADLVEDEDEETPA